MGAETPCVNNLCFIWLVYNLQSSTDGQNQMTRAQVAVEMLCLGVNGIFEFKEGPSLEEVSYTHLMGIIFYAFCQGGENDRATPL